MAEQMTRRDYIDRKITHEQYYGSIVAAAQIPLQHHKDLTRWQDMIDRGDEDLTGLDLNYWDALAATWQASITRALRTHGDSWSLAGGVCTIKATVRTVTVS